MKAKNKKLPDVVSDNDEQLPLVSILMAVYNEEKVIYNKIESVFNTLYPKEKLEFVIGSDGSTDNTDNIIEAYIAKGYNIQFRKFQGRSGKSNILNSLSPIAQGSIYILTDANILFDQNTIYNLVKHFKREDVGLVGANILNTGLQKLGISFQEKTYIKRENLIKYQEGVIWGTMMGAFGACYAVRKNLFIPIPQNFLMEDFFISMHVLRMNMKCINDMSACAYEDVSNLIREEYKRKIRISAGNFQNLGVYYSLMKNPFSGVGFCFLSHKFLRWIGPLLICMCYLSTGILMSQNLIFFALFIIQTLGFVSPFIDWILSKMNIHNFAVRLVAYFYSMNLALLLGFVRYARGIKTNAWTPTIRNIDSH